MRTLLGDLQARRVDLVSVETATASPYASSLLFDYIATYMYEDDTPLAERRAQALSLDADLMRELLGQEELRDLLDAEAIAEVEEQLRGSAKTPDQLHDLLLRRGDLLAGEYDESLAEPLLAERRAATIRVGGEERLIAVEDAGRYRDALGAMPPSGLPDAFLDAGEEPLRFILVRFARGRGPFTTAEAVARFGPERRGGARQARGRGPARARRAAARRDRARVVRPGRPAPPAPRLPRPPAPPGGARRAGLARAVPPGLAGRRPPRDAARGARPAPGALASGVALGVGRPAAPRARLPARAARPALRVRRGRLDRRRARARGALLPRGRARARAARARCRRPRTRRTRRSAPRSGQGALFWFDLLQATGLEGETALPALWDLVWAGEATNDAWTPLRASRRFETPRPEQRRPRRFSRQRANAITATQGRWSLTEPLFAGEPDPRALAELLLERQGIVTRDGVRAEGVPGGYARVYQELRKLETLGTCRRGYFVESLGGAQFALPGAVERLREEAEPDAPLVLAAADPAQPYGASLPWPKRADGRAARVAGALVVTLGGEPALFVERGGRSLVPLRDPEEAWLRPALEALVEHARRTGVKRLAVERFDSEPVADSVVMPLLLDAGFLAGPRRAVLRA